MNVNQTIDHGADRHAALPDCLRPGESFVLDWTHGDTRPTCMIDFGPDGVGGYPTVEIEAVRGTPRLRLAYACVPVFGPEGDFQRATSARYLGPDVDLPILPASLDRFDVFDVAGPRTWRAPLQQGLLRYVRVSLDSPGTSVRISSVRLENLGTHSKEPVAGSFECSDPALAALWRASVRTCQLAAIPARTAPLLVETPNGPVTLGPTFAYVSDGAKRDRLVWSGDLWWAQRNMYVAFAPDSPFMPGSLRMLAENQTPEGYIQACPYPESHGPVAAGEWGPFASDEFAAWFLPVLWDHILHTGDLALARDLYPNAVRLLAYLRDHTGRDGVFVQRPETSKHADALVFGTDNTRRRSYMHILLWLARSDAARLARILGHEDDAVAFQREADVTAAVVRARFVRDDGLLANSFECRDAEPAANALALVAGFFTADEARRALPLVPRISHGKFQALLVRGAFRYGLPDEAVRRIHEHNWLKIVDSAWAGLHTTSECTNYPTNASWGDEAHPDTALAGALTNGILGVRPLAPGYAQYAFEPGAAKGIEWARGTIPTPRGTIVAEWRRIGGRIEKHLDIAAGNC